MMIPIALLFLLAAPAIADDTPPDDRNAWLRNVSCRIASRNSGPAIDLKVLNDVLLDTLSVSAADRTFETSITGGRKLTASVQHVRIDLPRERFNVTMTLDGKTLLRLNHLDMDIYLESTIDGQAYILHCFRMML